MPLRVLLVTSDPALRDPMQEMLLGRGDSVIVASPAEVFVAPAPTTRSAPPRSRGGADSALELPWQGCALCIADCREPNAAALCARVEAVAGPLLVLAVLDRNDLSQLEAVLAACAHDFLPWPVGAPFVLGRLAIADKLVAQDARRRAQAKVSRAAENRFRKLVDDLHMGVIVQGPRAEILLSNAQALNLLGLTESQILGKSSFDPDWNVTREDGAPFPGEMHPVPRAIATRKSVRNVVMGVFRPHDKSRVWLLVHAEPHLDASGEVEQVICTFSDITDRKTLEAQLLVADRMASMGILAAGVAHEINNPLAYVLANIGFIEEELQSLGGREISFSRTVAEQLAAIKQGAERVRLIVRDLKLFSRDAGAERTAVSMPALIESTCNIAYNEIRHRARIVKDFDAVPPVHASEARLGQVFLNLLINAAQAIEEGNAEANTITVKLRREGEGQVVVAVIDTGAGIPEAVLARMFDPFFTTKPVGIGTGLGLSICRGIVHELGGDISARSVPGKGSTFRVVLPIGQPVNLPVQLLSVAPGPAPRGRILIIDDDELVARVLQRTLDQEHDITVHNDGKSALEQLSRGAEFDVILCDMMMPDQNGPEIYQEIASISPWQASRVVFITGGAFTPRSREFLESSKLPCVEKPFRRDELRRLIQRMMKAPPR